MAVGATGTPTTNYAIPKYATGSDAPFGQGFNSAMDFIDNLLKTGFLAKPGSPASGNVLTYNGSDWVAAAPASQASVTPVSFQTPSAGAYWIVTAIGATSFLAPRWEYSDATTSSVYGTVLVPAGVSNATLRFLLAANATTGNARVQGFVASAADGGALAAGTWNILNSATTVTMPGTAWLRKDLTFALSGLNGGDILEVAFTRLGADGADTLAAALAMFGAWLEPA